MSKKTKVFFIIFLNLLGFTIIILHSCGCQFNCVHDHLNDRGKDPVDSGSIPWIGTQFLGTSVEDVNQGISIDSAGNIYVTGHTFGDLDGKSNMGNGDSLLVKYDSTGAKQWTQLLGGNDLDVGHAVSADSAGNIYVTGRTESDLDGKSNAGQFDMFLAKYNSSGVKQWTQLLGTTFEEYSNGVSTDSLGNIYVTGYTYGNLDGKSNAGQQDIFLVKYNSAGVKQWTQLLGTTSFDAGNGISIDSLGNIYVTGYTSGKLDGKSNAGGNDVFLVKYNSAGIKQWTQLLGSNGTDAGNGISIDSLGNIYVTGHTLGNLDGKLNAGNNDIFLAKYNSAGVKQWIQLLGSTNTDIGNGVSTDRAGNIYVTGYTLGFIDKKSNAGHQDIFLAKYNSAGVKKWCMVYGTNVGDTGNGVSTDSSGHIYITGHTYGNFEGKLNSGSSDIFLIKYNSEGTRQ